MSESADDVLSRLHGKLQADDAYRYFRILNLHEADSL